MLRRLSRKLTTARDQGASAVEYGLMVAAIAAVIVGIVFGVGGMLEKAFEQTATCIELKQSAPVCEREPGPGIPAGGNG